MTEMTRRVSLVLLSSALLAGCKNFRPPASNTPVPLNADGSVSLPWSPYIVIQPDQGAFPGYVEAIRRLQAKGMIRGARIEIFSNGGAVSTVNLVSGLGVEVTGLVSNQDLFRPDVENMIDEMVRLHPAINYFQIGNEITTIIPNDQPQMSLEKYMTVFSRVYNHVQFKHPGTILITQSTLGSGEKGPGDLRKMVELGLNKLPREDIRIGINFYDGDTNAYSSILNNDLAGYRVFIMESGIADWSRQIGYVQVKYPEFTTKTGIRAERIYYYVAWGGDPGKLTGGDDHSEFSLIRNPRSVAEMTFSPLMKSLVGEF